MTINDFLLARIAEDEAGAEAAIRNRVEFPYEWQQQIDGDLHSGWSFTPERLLAECTARRRVIRTIEGKANWRGRPAAEYAAFGEYSGHLLALLAQPYSDHPEFDASWSSA